jgi:hypothetical protein
LTVPLAITDLVFTVLICVELRALNQRMPGRLVPSPVLVVLLLIGAALSITMLGYAWTT